MEFVLHFLGKCATLNGIEHGSADRYMKNRIGIHRESSIECGVQIRESNMVLSKVEKPAIEAVLAEASAAKLKELAKNYYVKGYSKMNKPALVQAVSAALREPGRMEELLYIIDQPAFLLFRRAARSREPVKVKKALPEQCSLLEIGRAHV